MTISTNTLRCTSFLLGLFFSLSSFAQTDAITLNHDYSGQGGEILVHEEDGSAYLIAEPDINGTGGFFQILDGDGSTALLVDGNASSKSSVSIGSGANSATFNANNTGNSSVLLPAASISNIENANEAGIASRNLNAAVSLTTSVSNVLSRTISCPTAGYVLALASSQVRVNHVTGTLGYVNIGISTLATTLPATQDLALGVGAPAPTADYYLNGSATAIFSVAAGSNTFYYNAQESGAECTVGDATLVLLFVPTAYGTAVTTLTDDTEEDDMSKQSTILPQSKEDIENEKLQSIADYKASVAKELEAMKLQLAEIEKKQAKGNKPE